MFTKRMNIKELRHKTGLSQKEFGKRLGLTSQSITKFEGGGKVTETVQKLICYEFAKYLPEEHRLIATPIDDATPVNLDELKKTSKLIKEVEEWKGRAENLQKFIDLQDKTIKSLEDQIKMYKNQLGMTNDKSKTA